MDMGVGAYSRRSDSLHCNRRLNFSRVILCTLCRRMCKNLENPRLTQCRTEIDVYLSLLCGGLGARTVVQTKIDVYLS
jgi:hypothetical protein